MSPPLQQIAFHFIMTTKDSILLSFQTRENVFITTLKAVLDKSQNILPWEFVFPKGIAIIYHKCMFGMLSA